jgi:ribosome maturation factor RimP
VLAAVRPVADRIAADQGLLVWDVEFRREAGRDTLSVSVDHRGRVGSDEIAAYTEALSRALDADDVVPGDERYLLEVSSPGAERKLRTPTEFAVCEGRRVRITFKDGRPPVEGSIASADDEAVTVDGGDGIERVPFEDISQARLSLPGV